MHAIEGTNERQLPTADHMALCLGGAGIRGALFHVGALRRWNEMGLLAGIDSIHAVGGGSILAGMLACRWPSLGRGLHGEFSGFEANIAKPIERFCQRRLKLYPSMRSRLRPRNWKKLAGGGFTQTDRFVEILDERLFGGRLLSDISPFSPEVYWYATNLRTGGRWEFSRSQVGEKLLGYRSPDRVRLSEAVAGAMVSPAIMAPVRLESRPTAFEDGEVELHSRALRTTALLVDGGLHDPLAIESAISTSTIVVVSDGGSGLMPEVDFDDWMGNRLYRSIEVQNYRAVEVRRRWLVEMIRSGRIEGTYTSLAAQHRDYGNVDSAGYSQSLVERIGRMSGELTPFTLANSRLVVNHGYSIADASARRLLSHRIRIQAPFRLPYPDVEIDETEAPRILSIGSRAPVRRAA